MIMRNAFAMAMGLVMLAAPAAAQNAACAQFDGALIIDADDEYIGKVTNSADRESIFNGFGRFGSEFRTESIWNQFGKNGSEFRSNSAFNEFSRNPPKIIKNGRIIGYLTTNDAMPGAVSPVLLGAVCYNFTPPR